MAKLLLKTIAFFFLVPALFWISGCNKDANDRDFPDASELDAEIAIRWMEKTRELTKNSPGFTPPVASRAFGYAGVTLYESVVKGMPGYRSLSGQLNAMPEMPAGDPGAAYYWPACANAAMAQISRRLYANMPTEQATSVDILEAEIAANFPENINEGVITISIDLGKRIAERVFEWSTGDGAHEAYAKNFPANYVPPTGAGKWAPTFPAFQKIPLQPFWGSNRPFVSGSINNSQPVIHKTYSTASNSPFYAQALEVYAITSNLTTEEITIARFWSDDPGQPGTPPGHSVSIATQVLEKEKASLALAAETYAKVGIAVADAFISCWKCKYDYNLLRPITYIRDQIDANWTPVLNTPPFPEYTSGHSVQSAAAAQVLSDIFGYNYRFTDRTHERRTDINGGARTFSSFLEAAQEAAASRLYGGIHFRDAIDLGLIQGRKVGESVGALRFKE